MRSRWWVLFVPLVAALPAAAAPDSPKDQDLSNLSIEELAQIPVRSASKTEEPLSTAATALYVITNDDILRSAATSLPEVLRQAPNLHVERVDATQYAISARGFNGVETSNKLLVLSDGRSVYSTLHSGVFWQLQSPLLEDIDQIEVVSGPGGTLYGPNAVNGVINITTKDATDTVGLLARATGGAQERTAAARYGVKLGDNAALRVYADYFDREELPASFGPADDDGIRGWQAGFRADVAGESGHATVQGDIFRNDTFKVDGEGNRGQDILGRYTRELTANSSLQIQAYYDYSRRLDLLTEDVLETFDAEAQYNLEAGAHHLVAGAGIRTTRDQFINNLNAFQLDPQRERLWIGNGFVQDRFALSPKFSVIGGVKVESSTFSGAQALPSLRLAWQPSPTALFWTAVSRAVRTPSRIDRDLNLPGLLAKAPDFGSEKLVAFEAGYRGQPTHSTSLSINLFANRYNDLRAIGFLGPVSTLLPLQIQNGIRGWTYGLDAWGTQQVAPWWRLSAGVSLLHKHFEVQPGASDLSDAASIGRDPDHQLELRSSMTLPHGLLIDAGLRKVGALPDPHVDGYVEADARVGVSLIKGVELYVSGENLLHAQHLESNDLQRTHAVPRIISAGTRLSF